MICSPLARGWPDRLRGLVLFGSRSLYSWGWTLPAAVGRNVDALPPRTRGWSRGADPRRVDLHLFPVPVGDSSAETTLIHRGLRCSLCVEMDPSTARSRADQTPASRARGDGPRPPTESAFCSLWLRGWSLREGQRLLLAPVGDGLVGCCCRPGTASRTRVGGVGGVRGCAGVGDVFSAWSGFLYVVCVFRMRVCGCRAAPLPGRRIAPAASCPGSRRSAESESESESESVRAQASSAAPSQVPLAAWRPRALSCLWGLAATRTSRVDGLW